MKKFKFLAAPLLAAAALLMASAASAQSVTILVGSSGGFNSFALAAINGTSPVCGANIWTNKSSDTTKTAHAHGIDARSSFGVPSEGGNVWIAWDNGTTPTTICAYFSVDSVVGQRLFFGTNGSANGTLTIDPGATSQTGDQAVPYVNDLAVTLPTAVYNALNGTNFTAAVSDIRPEDALYANLRAFVSCNGSCATDTSKSGLGYGPYPVGQAVQSTWSNTSAKVVAYSISGQDPITQSTIPAYVTTPVGAYPVMIFANVVTAPSTTGAQDFNKVIPNNITSHAAATIWSGYSTRTTDVTGVLATGSPLNVVEREPVSGTFNTFEWQVVRAKGTVLSQEIGVNPANSGCFVGGTTPSECGNPFYHVASNGATRSRAIGTGEEVSETSALANSLGYAFWSFSTYNGKTNLHYLQLDDVDPLFANYGTGVFPTCTGTAPNITCTAVPFTNIINGGYRAWNIIRIVSPTPVPAGVTSLLAAAQTQASTTLPDFVPYSQLAVFRSHYGIPPIAVTGGGTITVVTGNPFNGTNQTAIGSFPAHYENGGDMAGAIFPVQADVDFSLDNGAGHQLTGYIQ
ncbi:MAG TPA: hypothetical protein VGD60_14645 [Candidatus Acidoferrales bacterium]